jgi:hypothetical protein
VLLVGCAIALVVACAATALQKPGRSIGVNGQVRLVALDHASFAFVVARTKKDCEHVELWNTDTKGLWRFGKPGPCTNLGSTGAGISAVAATGNRVVWIRFNGGNLRDWQLMTATTTQKTPKQIRFIEQDVDLPSPLALGDATGDGGVPYAAGKEVVLLDTNGAAVFKHTEPVNIVRLTSGKGPGGAVVAALRETGAVVLLRSDGSIAQTIAFPAGAVKAMALAPVGLVAQLAGSVEIHNGTRTKVVKLPAGAQMTDYASGRILYTTSSSIHTYNVAGGQDTVLLAGAGKAAVLATYDTHGLGWARGTTVSFACAGCVKVG